MKRILLALMLVFSAQICRAELRFIVVEVYKMTNTASNGVITIDGGTNLQVAVSIRSQIKSEQREKTSINDAAKLLTEGIAFTGGSVDVIMVLHEGVHSFMVRSLIKAINENLLLQLIDLRDISDHRIADQILKSYGIKSRGGD